MFFRPEEIHRASRVREVEHPPSDRGSDVADQPLRVLGHNRPVLHLYPYWLAAIQAHRIDSHRLTGKEPADRQRFEGSLAEPLLLPVDGQSVMGWQIVEGGEGHDGVGLRKEPPREPANPDADTK